MGGGFLYSATNTPHVKPTTIRLPEDVLDDLDREAQEHGFHTRTEYLRYLIDNRELVVSITLEEREDRLEALSRQVEELESRLGELEERRPREPAAPAGETVAAVGDDSEELQALAGGTELAGAADMVEEPEEELEELELEDPGLEDIETRAQRLDFFSPSQEIRRDREQAVVAAWEELADAGEITREELERSVFPNHTATFTTFDGWYDRLVVPSLEQLEDVEQLDTDRWEYVGE